MQFKDTQELEPKNYILITRANVLIYLSFLIFVIAARETKIIKTV